MVSTNGMKKRGEEAERKERGKEGRVPISRSLFIQQGREKQNWIETNTDVWNR